MGEQRALAVMFAGGGTGGHLFPGIAVAEELQKRCHDVDIVFVGTERGIEASVLPREGFPVEYVGAEGFAGTGFVRKLKSLLRMVAAVQDSFAIIGRRRPDIIIGLGGYASFATVLAGLLKKIPTVVLEQNSVPGLANKVLGRFAQAVCVTYQESMAFFPKHKTYLTGNPIRDRILRGSRVSAIKIFGLESGKFTVFVFGGSRGASSINKAMVEALQYLLDVRDELQFLHQTGEKDYEFVRDAYRSYGFRGMVTPFVFQMAEAYIVSDLVIARAGATTLAELTALGKASILIPYPFAAGGHQEFNAKKIERMQAATVVLDRDLGGKLLAEYIREMFVSGDKREKMQLSARALGQPHAAGKVADIAMSLARRVA